MKIIKDASDVQIKKKKYSKHKKSYQRSKIDISDIYDAQDTINREERLAESLAKVTISSDSFFSLDVGEKKSEKIKPAKRQKRKTAAPTVLRCHKYLNGLPGAKAISKKGDVVKQRMSKVLKTALQSRKNTNIAAGIRKNSLRVHKAAFKAKRTALIGVKASRDLWVDKKSPLDQFDEVSKTYMKFPMKYQEVQTKKHLQAPPKNYRTKPSSMETFPAPMPGHSYNPTLTDHLKLVKKATKREDKRLLKVKKDKQRYKNLPTKGTDGISQKQFLKEMSQGLPLPDLPEEEEEEDEKLTSDQESLQILTALPIERRTMQSRRKEKDERRKVLKRLQVKKRKKQENDIQIVKTIKKEIEVNDLRLKKRKLKNERKKEESKYRTKKLSKIKYVEPEIVVALTENEMAGSLRKLEPMGNILWEHYSSYQKRSLIEVRYKKTQPDTKGRLISKKGVKKDMNQFVKNVLKM